MDISARLIGKKQNPAIKQPALLEQGAQVADLYKKIRDRALISAFSLPLSVSLSEV